MNTKGTVRLSIPQAQGEEKIYNIPRKDAKILDAFFRELVRSSAAYTFSGKKPLSFIGFNDSWPYSLLPKNTKILRGWSTWQKYSHLFHNQRMKVWIEEDPWFEGRKIVIVADIEALDRTLRSHEQTFKEALNLATFQPEQLREKRPLFSKGLQKDDMLIGILLGYGLGNAKYFKERAHIKSVSNTLIWESDLIDPICKQMNRKLWLLRRLGFSEMLPPMFVGFPDSEESKALKEMYLEDRERIIQLSKGRKFLETALSLYQNGQAVL